MKNVVLGSAIVLLWFVWLLCWYPPNDSVSYDQCVDSHMETTITLAENLDGDMVPVTNNTIKCDQLKTYTCQDWAKTRNFLGREHQRCLVYK